MLQNKLLSCNNNNLINVQLLLELEKEKQKNVLLNHSIQETISKYEKEIQELTLLVWKLHN